MTDFIDGCTLDGANRCSVTYGCRGYCKQPALAQPEQEPVARVDYDRNGNIAWLYGPVEPDGTLLYTAPPSIEAAVLAEREACAKVCDEWNTAITDKLAAAIRARSEK